MAELYFEDFAPGASFEFSAGREITRDEIIAFARAFDPQPFHLDEIAAKKTMLGGLSASGWHTCALLMRLQFDHWLGRTASMGAPGIDEVRWAKPVRPGDLLRVKVTTGDKRVSASKPAMGLVPFLTEVFNQGGETVLVQRHTQMIEVRHPAVAAAAPVARPAEKPKARPPAPLADPIPVQKMTGYFEDVVIGAGLDLGSETFTKDGIIAFARDYDPQRFHIDEDEARNSHFGALAASGWHTASLWMRNIILTRDRIQKEMAATGVEMAAGGPSPGFANLRWWKPVFAGDTISYATRSVEKRITSKPGWGLMFSQNTGVNQHGEPVFEFRGSAFVKRRG